METELEALLRRILKRELAFCVDPLTIYWVANRWSSWMIPLDIVCPTPIDVVLIAGEAIRNTEFELSVEGAARVFDVKVEADATITRAQLLGERPIRLEGMGLPYRSTLSFIASGDMVGRLSFTLEHPDYYDVARASEWWTAHYGTLGKRLVVLRAGDGNWISAVFQASDTYVDTYTIPTTQTTYAEQCRAEFENVNDFVKIGLIFKAATDVADPGTGVKFQYSPDNVTYYDAKIVERKPGGFREEVTELTDLPTTETLFWGYADNIKNARHIRVVAKSGGTGTVTLKVLKLFAWAKRADVAALIGKW